MTFDEPYTDEETFAVACDSESEEDAYSELSKDIEELERLENESLQASDFVSSDPISEYVKSIEGITVLTPEEELKLTTSLVECRSIIDKLNNIISQSEDSEQRRAANELLETTTMKYSSIRDELITRNIRLSLKVANSFKGCGVDFDDLIQEGNTGIMKAIETFDPTRGCKFSTYAVWWIRQKIMRYIGNTGLSIRLPIHMRQKVYSIKNAKRKLEQELNRTPTHEEIMKEANLTKKEYKEVYYASFTSDTLSLDKPFNNSDGDGDSDFYEFIGDNVNDAGLSLEEEAIAFENCEQIDTWLTTLEPREQLILKLRYGLEDGMCYTLEEVGNIFGVTRERIRQLEDRAIRELRACAEFLNKQNGAL